MGIDDPSFTPPVIDLLPSKLFLSVVWGNTGRLGIDMQIEFTKKWVNSVKPMVVMYADKRCRIMGYCSSATDAKNNVHGKLQIILRDAGIAGDTIALTAISDSEKF